MLYFLMIINFLALITIYFLNKTIASVQHQNKSLVGDLQNLNNEILYLKDKNSAIELLRESAQSAETAKIVESSEVYTPGVILGAIGVVAAIACGFALLFWLKSDVAAAAALSKNNVKATGDYVKDIVVPSVDILNKSSEARINANVDNLQKVVVDTGNVITNHVTEVNKESTAFLFENLKASPIPKVLGKISKEILHYVP